MGRLALSLTQRGHHVHVQRLSYSSRLLAAIQHGDGLHRRRQSMHKMLNGKWPVEPDLEHSEFGSAAVEMINRLLRDLCAGAHKNKDLFRVGSANIIK